jgi:hypothetical protein
MAIVQGAALAVGLIAVTAVVIASGSALTSAASGLVASALAVANRLPLTVETAAFVLRGALLAIGTWILLIPVAVYLASDE